MVVPVELAPGQTLLDAVVEQLSAAQLSGHVVLRWGLLRADKNAALLELGLAEGVDGENGPLVVAPQATAPHTAETSAATEAGGTHVALVVPTGVGAQIGGFIGDAGPWARVFEAVADTVIVHPNVVNAADFSMPGDRSRYVDGFTLDRFLDGQLRLAPRRTVPVGLVLDDLDEGVTTTLINAANAMHAAGGVEMVGYAVCAEKVKTNVERSPIGHFIGSVDNPEVLFGAVDAVTRAGAEAVAVVTAMSGVREEDLVRHYSGAGPNPVGAIEALISRSVTWHTGLPCAHAPAFVDGLGQAAGVVDPRAAAEVASGTGLPCVLQGLHRTPRPVATGGLGVHDLGAIVVPFDCAGGAPALAARHTGVPLVAVRANRCEVGAAADLLGVASTVVVDSYAEAVAYVAALRAGVSWTALGAPAQRLRQL